MRSIRTWHRASLFVALSLVTASAAAFAANPKPNQQALSFSHVFNPGQGTWLGLVVKDVNEASAKELKLPGDYGAIVVSVIPDSPAAKAGIQKNDVILQFASWRVWSAAQLQRLVKETPPGRTVKIQISRQGKLQTLQMKVENRGPSAFLGMPGFPNHKIWRWPAYKLPLQPEQPKGPWVWQKPFIVPPFTPHQKPFVEPAPRRKVMPLPPFIPKFYLGPLPNPKARPLYPKEPFTEPGPNGKNRPFGNLQPARENTLGISGQNLTPQLARYFGVKEGHGVLITQVDKGSPASAAGLKAGDVIVSVGSQEVGSMAELQWALQSRANGQHRVTLGIVRNRAERKMSVLLNPELPTPGQHRVKPEPIMALQMK